MKNEDDNYEWQIITHILEVQYLLEESNLTTPTLKKSYKPL